MLLESCGVNPPEPGGLLLGVHINFHPCPFAGALIARTRGEAPRVLGAFAFPSGGLCLPRSGGASPPLEPTENAARLTFPCPRRSPFRRVHWWRWLPGLGVRH